jgi:polyhydroxybutyrate depolymerase
MIGVLLLCGCAWTASTEEAGASSNNWSPGNHTLPITVDGLERRYVVHVPQGCDRNKHWPAVIMFHGGGGTARAAMWGTGWAEKADREGFLAVFPEGTPPDPSRPARFIGNPQTWNDGSKRSNVGAVVQGVADTEFVSAMLFDLNARFKVEKRRIYATGFSNGASMTFRLARELSLVIAAVAPVAGVDWLENKMPDRAVPLLYITGTADPLNPIEGGEIHIGLKSYGKKPATDDMIRKWVKLHGCPDDPRVVHDNNGARAVAYGHPGAADAIVLYILDGHGHHWPGGKSLLPEAVAGKNASKLNATDVIWEFFKTNSLPAIDGKAAQSGIFELFMSPILSPTVYSQSRHMNW